MQVYKRISFIQLNSGWQTYVFPVQGGHLRYKFIATNKELNIAIKRCQESG